jgi:hypothetical protein
MLGWIGSVLFLVWVQPTTSQQCELLTTAASCATDSTSSCQWCDSVFGRRIGGGCFPTAQLCPRLSVISSTNLTAPLGLDTIQIQVEWDNIPGASNGDQIALFCPATACSRLRGLNSAGCLSTQGGTQKLVVVKQNAEGNTQGSVTFELATGAWDQSNGLAAGFYCGSRPSAGNWLAASDGAAQRTLIQFRYIQGSLGLTAATDDLFVVLCENFESESSCENYSAGRCVWCASGFGGKGQCMPQASDEKCTAAVLQLTSDQCQNSVRVSRYTRASSSAR